MTLVIGLFNYQKNTFDSLAQFKQATFLDKRYVFCMSCYQYLSTRCQGTIFVIYATVGVFTTKSIEFIINTKLGKPNEHRSRS